jgi:hypothetical protein
MYCEGYWGEGVCTADMNFCGEPTADGDAVADYARRWYEINRETWCDRHRICNLLGAAPDRSGVHADEFMLSFIGEIYRIQEEGKRQAVKRAASRGYATQKEIDSSKTLIR